MEADEKACPQCAETVKAAAKVCRFCGYNFETRAPSAPAMSAKDLAQDKKRKNGVIGCGTLIVVIIAGIIWAASHHDPSPPTTDGTSGAATNSDGAQAQNTAQNMPADEAAFIAAAQQAKTEYASGANDMQKGAARPARRARICAVLKGFRAANWVGTIKTLSSNGDGKGVLEISIADNVTIGTTNNDFSDTLLTFPTLLEPQSAVFKAVSSMKIGDPVVFSGQFIPNNVDCVQEQSITLEGSITDPSFLFGFFAVAAPGHVAPASAPAESDDPPPVQVLDPEEQQNRPAVPTLPPDSQSQGAPQDQGQAPKP